jgi:hypothetical protein
MTQHSGLTGSDLHEPKGASGASINTAYFSDGAASGAWAKVNTDKIDQSSVLNVNKLWIFGFITDISTAQTIYIPVPRAVTIQKVITIIEGTIATADADITLKNASASSMGIITVAFSGSGAGDIDTLSPSTNNTISEDSFFTIETDGASTNTIRANFSIEFIITS